MTPSAEVRRTHTHRERPLYRGLDAAAHGCARLWRQRTAARLRQEAGKVELLRAEWQPLADAELSARLAEHRLLLRRHPETNDVLFPLLAGLVEAARRHTGLLAHPEQVMGALALQRGFLAEMQTGEGKTLVIGLAAALAAWEAPACHVITANDYLASRDAAWLKGFYAQCGLTAGCVTGEMQDGERAASYAADITYTTAKEATADFLRDRLKLGPLAQPGRRLVHSLLQPERESGAVMRGLHRAIIDEADHALIDEAVTPLIISRTQENALLSEACRAAHLLTAALVRGEDYTIDQRTQSVALHPSVPEKLARAAAELPGIWNTAARRLELVTQALVAREFFHRDKQYLVQEGKVVIIDESTGRVMPQRTWRQGLHQAIEAKEGVTITAPTETLARLSFQRYFRLYDRLAGITGTGREAGPECWQVYGLPFVRIPTHRPCVRQHWPDRSFARVEQKWEAVADEIARLQQRGRPVLVGTRSVLASEHLAKLLRARGIAFALLNATNPEQEAAIVAEAGQAGRVTIATNMAGRGTDIKLGDGVAELGGLHVLATERHDSLRVDRQLFGRAGRQGDPGSAQAFISLEDDLLRRHTPGWLLRSVTPLLRSPGTLTVRLAHWLVTRAQSRASAAARRQRKQIQLTDSWLDEMLAFAASETGG